MQVIHLIHGFEYQGLVLPLAIIQGKTYKQFQLRFDGDQTATVFKGQVRNKYVEEDDSIVYADFDFSFIPPVYDPVLDLVQIVL